MKMFSRKTNNDTSKLFKILFDNYKDKVYKTAFYILKNEHDSKDVVQEAFIIAYNKIDTLRDHSKFENWICKIAFNLAINKYKNNQKEIFIDDYEKINSLLYIKNLNDPDEILDIKENRQYIIEEINKLKIEFKEVLYLYYYVELDYDEISEMLGIKIGTVRSRLFRAKEHLREKLILSNHQMILTERRISNE